MIAGYYIEKGIYKMNKFLKKTEPYLEFFKSHSKEHMRFDYFIKFNEKSIKLVSLELLRPIGEWLEYGNLSFRGWSTFTKEEIEEYIIEKVNISEEDFEVIKASNDLFRIRIG